MSTNRTIEHDDPDYQIATAVFGAPVAEQFDRLRIGEGVLTLESGGATLQIAYEEGSFSIEDPEPRRELIATSFSTTFTGRISGGWFPAPPEPLTLDMTISGVYPRNPDPGALRAWARTVSRTPWRRRSLADWRRLWRDRMGGRSWSITMPTRVVLSTQTTIAVGPGDRFGSGPVSYDVVMVGTSC